MKTKKAEILFEYNGKQYTLIEDYNFQFDDGRVYDFDNLMFQWKENNFSCDCNRSMFIQQQCDPNFEKMDCGEKIKLISIKEIES